MEFRNAKLENRIPMIEAPIKFLLTIKFVLHEVHLLGEFTGTPALIYFQLKSMPKIIYK